MQRKSILICPVNDTRLHSHTGEWDEIPWDGQSDMTHHVTDRYPQAHSMDNGRMAVTDGRCGVRMIAAIRTYYS